MYEYIGDKHQYISFLFLPPLRHTHTQKKIHACSDPEMQPAHAIISDVGSVSCTSFLELPSLNPLRDVWRIDTTSCLSFSMSTWRAALPSPSTSLQYLQLRSLASRIHHCRPSTRRPKRPNLNRTLAFILWLLLTHNALVQMRRTAIHLDLELQAIRLIGHRFDFNSNEPHTFSCPVGSFFFQ